jgi:hypothetical protein
LQIRYLKAKLKVVTGDLESCMQSLRERDVQLREQTKLREEWEASSNKASNALAAIKTKMDKIKHDLDERNKQATRPFLIL